MRLRKNVSVKMVISQLKMKAQGVRNVCFSHVSMLLLLHVFLHQNLLTLPCGFMTPIIMEDKFKNLHLYYLT